MKKYILPLLSILGLIIIIVIISLIVNKTDPTTINTNDLNKNNENITNGNDLNMSINKNTSNIVVIETTKGNIEVELNSSASPITVKNFKTYVSAGFYDGTVYHRVIPGFMIQGGGFLPNGNQKEVMSPIKLESNNGLSNLTGTIAMARTNVPDSATSQFFINTKDNTFLDYVNASNPGYAVFGKVISGMDVVYEIEKVSTTTKYGMYQDWPVDNIVINRVYFK